MKELTLLQVTKAGRGASAGTYSQPQSFDLGGLPRERLLWQVPCQAGWEQLRPLLSAPHPPNRGRKGLAGPSEPVACRQGTGEGAVRR